MGLPRGAVNDCLLHAALFFKETITHVIVYAFLGFYGAFLLYGSKISENINLHLPDNLLQKRGIQTLPSYRVPSPRLRAHGPAAPLHGAGALSSASAAGTLASATL